ncbi:MAG: hypothetical protein ABIT70_10835 [Sulfuriferula sp.]
MVDPVALKSEITTDPKALGYAPYVTATNDNAIAGLLNALTGVGAATIQLSAISRGAVLSGVVPGNDQLATGLNLSSVAIPTATANKWSERFAALRSADDTVPLTANFMGLLGQLFTDNLMTQAQIDAITKRTGSRAEVLWGAGTIIGWRDVAAAFGRIA